VGLLLAIDPILDMGRTAVNVAGQALVPTIVAKRQGILDESLYNAPRNGTPFVEEDTDSSVTDGNSTDTASRELQDAKA
ncbi:MAG: cation:dicarboxylase symporter family transporter, partial [Pseudarthrobacter sp.]|nr:cation:dicarboxylase symporter family transporter [Pseudarthrobacter sp.]